MGFRIDATCVVVGVSLFLLAGCGWSGDGDGSSGSTSGGLAAECWEACENIKEVCENSDPNSPNPFTDVSSCADSCAHDDSKNAREGANCLAGVEQCSEYATCYQQYYADNQSDDELGEQDVTRTISPIDDALCERKYIDCCSDMENATVFDDYDSFKSNTNRVVFECQKIERFPDYTAINKITRSINAGRIDFDDSAVSDCVDKAKALSCSDIELGRSFAPYFDDCSVFNPAVDIGGECLTDFDCRGGYCAGAKPSDGELGTCKKTGGDGESCADAGYKSSFDCEVGLQCADDTCAPALEGGKECTFDSECLSGWCKDDAGVCSDPTCNEK